MYRATVQRCIRISIQNIFLVVINGGSDMYVGATLHTDLHQTVSNFSGGSRGGYMGSMEPLFWRAAFENAMRKLTSYPGYVVGGKTGLVYIYCLRMRERFRKFFANKSEYGQVTHGCYAEK